MKRCLSCMEEYAENYDHCPRCDPGQKPWEERPQLLTKGCILQGRYIVGACQRIRSCDITYIGWDALFERKVQIREFFPVRFVTRADGGSLQIKEGMNALYNENLARFEGYHKSLIRLYKEEDIISVFSCFQANGTAYAVMQQTDAATLLERIENGTSIGSSEALAFLHQAMEAVKKVHALGLVHGAIRLSSFWITEDGNLVLKDFAEPCHYCGSPGMKDFNNVGPWIDVYGLSMLFGKLLIGWEDVTPTEILEALEENDKGLPARLTMAIECGLDMGNGYRIKSLEEYQSLIFADSVTMRLVACKVKELPASKNAKSERAGRKRRAMAWSLAGLAACVLMAAALAIARFGGWILF